MYILSPSIYAADYLKLKEQISTLKKLGITRLHIDIMDGNFVPNLSFGPDFVKAIRSITDMKLDVHLMVEYPGRFIREFVEAGADIITVHYEAGGQTFELLDQIHAGGQHAGVVLKPETRLERLEPEIWERADVIQIMTIQPGMKGQHFIEPMLEKIEKAYRLIQKSGRDIDIEVDGDITETRLLEVLSAGANVVVVGKALFNGNLEENVLRYLKLGFEREEMIS